ncbi:hypothetical protein CDD83_965 [Cordyceps sp. RAO-2017]|nr:hypothetical protein CDD83_965 [Cordyceps sp. RAO-2017]
MVGPTINTVPMRIKLADQGGSAVNVAQALAQVQKLSDDARGTDAMASLRMIQTAWRSSSRDPEHVPASLFQSLFVFDGIIAPEEVDSDGQAQPLFRPVQIVDGDSGDGPAYDDYPLIVSFHIKNNTLHGKLRAKMTTEKVEALGGRLEAAVRCVVSCGLQRPALDVGHMETIRQKLAMDEKAANGKVDQAEMVSQAPTADAVLEVVKKVLGARCRGKDIGYNTKLVNVGLDSILAIRLSQLLRKQMGIGTSVFEMIKGASVHDIVKRSTSTRKVAAQQPRQELLAQKEWLKELVAKELGLARELVNSVLPVLAGQRTHLEQWMYNGKRFFEAPWVYRVDDSVDAQRVASCWAELCRVHDILRTTFVWADKTTGLVQVTLVEHGAGQERFAVLQDSSKTIQALISQHVGEENGKPSNLREPPARLSFLDGLDGKAVVLRVHHALYDAWSIKMIQRDLDKLLASGKVLRPREPLQDVVRQIRDMRQLDAEESYWKHHLSHAQDTVLHDASTASSSASPLGPHFKASHPALVPQKTADALGGSARVSAAIILAYARALGRLTKRARPTFGLNHASRSLESADGARTLDLTAASVPTLTVTPFCLDLGASSSSSEEQWLGRVQDQLAQLARFAQADSAQRLGPRFNSYLNILHRGAEADDDATFTALRRHRLGEPLASAYFTAAAPSSAPSTIEQLETSHLCPHRLFFNVVVHQGQGIGATVGGDVELSGVAAELVSRFREELVRVVEGSVCG